jgi:hypothetical protein
VKLLLAGVGVEPRGRLIRSVHFDQPGLCVPGGSEENMPKPQDKPFDIPKPMVRDAFRRVAANKGAPGVDGQSLEQFEADLEDNLYKIWNVCHECGERVIGRRSCDRGNALRKMEGGPPGSSYGGRFQTATCCVG